MTSSSGGNTATLTRHALASRTTSKSSSPLTCAEATTIRSTWCYLRTAGRSCSPPSTPSPRSSRPTAEPRGLRHGVQRTVVGELALDPHSRGGVADHEHTLRGLARTTAKRAAVRASTSPTAGVTQITKGSTGPRDHIDAAPSTITE
jgi:hypothetical protein